MKTLWKITVAAGNVQKQMLVANLCCFIQLLSPAPLQFQTLELRLCGPWSTCQPISWMIRQFLNDELDYCQSVFLLLLTYCVSVVTWFCVFTNEGGTLLTISGFGFHEYSKVLVGNETCNVIEGDLNKITCRTPKVRHPALVIFF